MSETTRIIQALTHACGQSTIHKPVGLHEPSFADTRAWDYVKDCLDTGWVSSAGGVGYLVLNRLFAIQLEQNTQ